MAKKVGNKILTDKEHKDQIKKFCKHMQTKMRKK
jgi:hypothetical protein